MVPHADIDIAVHQLDCTFVCCVTRCYGAVGLYPTCSHLPECEGVPAVKGAGVPTAGINII